MRARALGEKYYFTGRPCKKGHICEKRIIGGCVMCCLENKRKHAEKNKAKGRIYYIKNREILAKKAIMHREKNREPSRRSAKKYRANNREKAATCRRKCDLRRRDVLRGSHTHEDILFLLTKQKNKCMNCKKSVEKKYHVDHITPVAKGGMNDKKNLQILCPSCNHRKSAKDPIKWAQENGRLL